VIRTASDNVRDWQNNIGELPPACRPRGRMAFSVNSHDDSHIIQVYPSGQIVWMRGQKRRPWLSLAGVIIPLGTSSHVQWCS